MVKAFNSTDADYIKSQITAKIKNASITICLIGETTQTSRWVAWEIEKSGALGKRLLGVRIHSDSAKDPTPQALKDAGAKVVDWVIDDIVAFIDAS